MGVSSSLTFRIKLVMLGVAGALMFGKRGMNTDSSDWSLTSTIIELIVVAKKEMFYVSANH